MMEQTKAQIEENQMWYTRQLEQEGTREHQAGTLSVRYGKRCQDEHKGEYEILKMRLQQFFLECGLFGAFVPTKNELERFVTRLFDLLDDTKDPCSVMWRKDKFPTELKMLDELIVCTHSGCCEVLEDFVQNIEEDVLSLECITKYSTPGVSEEHVLDLEAFRGCWDDDTRDKVIQTAEKIVKNASPFETSCMRLAHHFPFVLNGVVLFKTVSEYDHIDDARVCNMSTYNVGRPVYTGDFPEVSRLIYVTLREHFRFDHDVDNDPNDARWFLKTLYLKGV